MSQEHARGATNTGREMQAVQQAERELHQAAMLLLDIAGDAPDHIAMNTNPAIPKKYVTVHRRLTLDDLRKHLQGRKTLGANLRHQDGTTRALCFDADDPYTWQSVHDAAISLEAEGYKPLLEPSPAQRGGHLWLIFSERVNASAAYNQVVALAPHLKDVPEYWPGRGNQKVRLPAGKYVTPAFSQWTYVVAATNRDISKTGTGAPNILDILLSNLTPAELIPDTPAAAEQTQTETRQSERSAPRPHRPPVTTEPDEQHRRKYGEHKMWVQWPSEQYLIDRFNSEYSIDDLAAPERNGLINAGTIGRPERTASVAVTKDGQRFTDFGKDAKQADGTPDGGDPFEFYVRSRNLEKAEALRELGRDLNRQASRELLRAARAGEQLAAWIMEIITPTGRAIYNENAARHGHPTLEAHAGGIVGFSPLDQPEDIR
jgi:TOTE conflict system primase-like protein